MALIYLIAGIFAVFYSGYWFRDYKNGVSGTLLLSAIYGLCGLFLLVSMVGYIVESTT